MISDSKLKELINKVVVRLIDIDGSLPSKEIIMKEVEKELIKQIVIKPLTDLIEKQGNNKNFFKECNLVANKIKHIQEWNISTTYTEPTKVMYKGNICVTIGINNKPITIPKD